MNPAYLLTNLLVWLAPGLVPPLLYIVSRRRHGRLAARMDASLMSHGTLQLHVAAILAAHFVQRVRDLSERTRLHGLEQLGEHIATLGRHGLQASQ